MGIFPNTLCQTCGCYYHNHSNKRVSHCIVLEERIKNVEESCSRHAKLLFAIISAYKKRGEAIPEIMTAAYEIGMSMDPNKFEWLDEYIKNL